jgi:hypothetical protein
MTGTARLGVQVVIMSCPATGPIAAMRSES